MQENNLELRMYGLVPYNISPIQQAIQFGHSVVEYSLMEDYREEYLKWAKKWKTFIILNGGTTNNTSPEKYGTLNKHLQTLFDNGIDFSYFKEPDLGDQLTAITFIVDERVFNREKYPDFKEFLINRYSKKRVDDRLANSFLKITDEFHTEYNIWCNMIGEPKNVFLREFLSQFRLA